MDPTARTGRALPAALVVAAALACGIAAAGLVEHPASAAARAVVWVAVAGVASLSVLACLSAVDAGRWSCLAGAALFAGLAISLQHQAARLRPKDEGVARVWGTVASAPRQAATGADVLAVHAYGTASQVFELEATAFEAADGTLHPTLAALVVRVQELGPLPPRGTTVRVTGWYRPPGQQLNPGARAPLGDGSLAVPRRSLVVAARDGPTLFQRLRLAADALLTAAFPAWAPPTWCALVKAMTTGVREPALALPAAQFRLAGMSHILAISGFNVAVLVGAAGAVARAVGASIASRAAVAVAISAVFLLVTEPEVSVLRAGLGAGLAALAGLAGGRARGLGTLGAVAAYTLATDPDSLYSPGFQLSFGVVLGLLTLASAPSERWQERALACVGRIAPAAAAEHPVTRLVVASLVGACVTSVVAWTVSSPVAAWHGGFFSTYAAPISVLTMPAAALVTMAGVAAMAVGAALPPAAAAVPGAVACGCAGFLDWTAQVACDLPGSAWWTGRPAVWWVAAAMVAVPVAWVAPSAAFRRGAWGALVLLAALLWMGPARPLAGQPPPGTLRADMLDVGNGSCVLVRAGGTCVLFDAGTSSDDSAGSRRMVPALAALGVRHLDAVVLSCDSLEHCSAIPEVVRAFGADRVVVPPRLGQAWERAAQGKDRRALGTLAAWLAERGVQPEAHAAGDDLRIGALAARVVWPAPGATPERASDAGLALLTWHASVQHAGAGRATPARTALLLTGPLEDEGCAGLLAWAAGHPGQLLPVAVMELPHHGSFREQAAQLVRALEPAAVLRSAGAQRVRTDRWAGIAPALRGVTALHGALRAEIAPDGSVQLQHWTDRGWAALEPAATGASSEAQAGPDEPHHPRATHPQQAAQSPRARGAPRRSPRARGARGPGARARLPCRQRGPPVPPRQTGASLAPGQPPSPAWRQSRALERTPSPDLRSPRALHRAPRCHPARAAQAAGSACPDHPTRLWWWAACWPAAPPRQGPSLRPAATRAARWRPPLRQRPSGEPGLLRARSGPCHPGRCHRAPTPARQRAACPGLRRTRCARAPTAA
ncbi:MAG: ComEC/Rec2 family competence protein [Phycisphaerales bacterium]